MKHSYLKGFVLLQFTNQNGEEKNVKYPLKKSFYDDICKLPESQMEYYLIHYYHENEIDRNQKRKEMKHRDIYARIDAIDSEEDELQDVSNDKIAQLSDGVDMGEKYMNRILLNSFLEGMSEMDKKITILSFGYEISNREIAKRLNSTETSIRRHLTKIEEKIKSFKKSVAI